MARSRFMKVSDWNFNSLKKWSQSNKIIIIMIIMSHLLQLMYSVPSVNGSRRVPPSPPVPNEEIHNHEARLFHQR